MASSTEKFGRGMSRLVGALLVALSGNSAQAQDFAGSLQPSTIPNLVGLGIGSYPSYFGSDENSIGIAPVGRMSFGGQRYATLAVNYLSVNLVNHSHLRAGPVGVVRFGRKDSDNETIANLPEINVSLNLGGFVGYEYNPSSDLRDSWMVRADISQDVSFVHDGYIAGVAAMRWLPIGKYAMLGFMLSGSYGSENYMDTYFSVDPEGSAASGLPIYKAQAGLRGAQASAMYLQPISPEWVAGAGLFYGRVLGEAADSPLVRDEGNPDQWMFGFGLGRIF